LFLNSIIPPSLRPKVRLFRFTFVFPAIYIFIFIAVFMNPTISRVAVIMPLHCLAVFCMFYNLYFVAKSLVLAETGKPTSFYYYAGPFFLIWFFPIGVWFIQPKINKLYTEKGIAESTGDGR
jgi:predicted branched-subunit amino acid permease